MLHTFFNKSILQCTSTDKYALCRLIVSETILRIGYPILRQSFNLKLQASIVFSSDFFRFLNLQFNSAAA